MRGAVDYLQAHEPSTASARRRHRLLHGRRARPGAGRQRPDAVKAVRAFYGLIPWSDAQPDWSNAAGRGARATTPSDDGFFGPDEVAQPRGRRCRRLGKSTSTSTIYPGVDHAFFNDTRPEVYDAEQSASGPGSAPSTASAPS